MYLITTALFFAMLLTTIFSQNVTTQNDLNLDQVIDVLTIDITDQAFEQIFVCPRDSDCHFVCHHAYAACLKSTFICEGSSRCSVECNHVLACSLSVLHCSDNSTCNITCIGKDSCVNVQSAGNSTGIYIPDITLAVDFTSTDDLVLVTTLAMNNKTVRNSYTFLEGYVQLLIYNLPTDPVELETFFAKLSRDKLTAQKYVNNPYWMNISSAIWNVSQTYVLQVGTQLDDFLGIALNDCMKDYTSFITPKSIHYDISTQKADLELTLVNPQIPFSYMKSLLEDKIMIYIVDLLSLPNASFVNLNTRLVNSTRILINVSFKSGNCTPPAPFYGTWCGIDGNWISLGDKMVLTDDLIASHSVNQGSLQVNNVPLLVIGSVLENMGNLFLNQSAVLEVNNSTVVIGSDLQIVGSTLKLSSTSKISVNGAQLQNATLHITLTPDEEEQYFSHNTVTIHAFNFTSSVGGNFDNIIVSTSNGTIFTACTEQYPEGMSYNIFLSTCDGPNNSVSNATLQTWHIIVIAIVSACALIACIAGFMYRFRKQKQALRRILNLSQTRSRSRANDQ